MRQLHCPVPETPVMPSCYSPPPGRPGGGGSLVAVFVMLIFALLFSPSSMQPTDTDALTIFRLRADTHGILAANWTTPDACSGRWHGVRCVAVEGRSRVTSLSLPSLDLRGPLDPLASLSELRSLDLHDNRLNGTLDLSLTSLPNLKFLYLSHNDLTGAIPPALGLIVRRLVRLDLSDNNLRGPIPATLSNLAHLLTLRLQDNLLSGSLPDISTALPALMDLNVSNNELQGRVPDGMRTRFGDAPFSGNAGLCGSKPPLPACGAPVETGRVPSSPAPTTAVVPSNPSSMPGSPATVAGGGEDVRRRLSRGAIIGIAIGNATLLLLLSSLLVAYCCCRCAPLEKEEVEDDKEWGEIMPLVTRGATATTTSSSNIVDNNGKATESRRAECREVRASWCSSTIAMRGVDIARRIDKWGGGRRGERVLLLVVEAVMDIDSSIWRTFFRHRQRWWVKEAWGRCIGQLEESYVAVVVAHIVAEVFYTTMVVVRNVMSEASCVVVVVISHNVASVMVVDDHRKRGGWGGEG